MSLSADRENRYPTSRFRADLWASSRESRFHRGESCFHRGESSTEEWMKNRLNPGPATIVMLAGALICVIAAPLAGAAAGQARHAQAVEAKAQRPAGPGSTGTTGRETPAGVFAVVEKNKDHHSSLYDDAWMPNMLRITWNG